MCEIVTHIECKNGAVFVYTVSIVSGVLKFKKYYDHNLCSSMNIMNYYTL